MGDVVHFARPLQWVLDLDVHGDEIRTLAEVCAWGRRPRRSPTYRLVALKCRIVAECVTSSEVQQELLGLAGRCDQISQKPISLVGMNLVAADDDAARKELRKLTRDARVLKRLGL
jgi:hypothetical protein